MFVKEFFRIFFTFDTQKTFILIYSSIYYFLSAKYIERSEMRQDAAGEAAVLNGGDARICLDLPGAASIKHLYLLLNITLNLFIPLYVIF
jgi:hypothetical protein